MGCEYESLNGLLLIDFIDAIPERPIISRKTKKIKFTNIGIQKAERGYD